MKMKSHPSSLSHVQEIISQTFFNESFKKYLQKMITKNAQQKIPEQSIKYANKLVHELVMKECIRPSIRTNQSQEKCSLANSDVLKVKMQKKKKLRNSSINFGNNQITNRRKSSRLSKLLSDSKENIELWQLPQCNNHDQSSYFSESSVNKNTKIQRHLRTSTQINSTLPFTPIFQNSRTLLPLIQNECPQQNYTFDNYLNRQLDFQIDSLRSRKIKLQAAFSCFDQRKPQLNFKQNQSGVPNKNNPKNYSKRTDQTLIKSLITDYDGEIILNQQKLKLERVPTQNKQNFYKNNVTPIIRIKTEVCPNYLQLASNKKSYKHSKKYIRHNADDQIKFSFQNSITSSKMMTQQSKSKSSIQNIRQNGKQPRPAVDKKKYRKSIQQSLFNLQEMTKSKRIMQKETNSRKNILFT